MQENSSFFGLFMLGILFFFYMAPAIIAYMRGRDGLNMITLLNLFLGWTVIGWVVLLVVAFTGETAAARKHREQQLMLLKHMADMQAISMNAPPSPAAKKNEPPLA